jgi:FkbM family methyltransferase
LVAAKWVGENGRVDAFEPDPINRQRLEEHLRENGMESRVRVHALAASSQAGSVELIHPKAAGTNHGMASFYKSLTGEGETYSVQTVRLDEYLDRMPQVIKLDIEGAELSAIEGMEKLVRSSTPPKLIIEHNQVSCAAAGYRPSDLFNKLMQLQPKYGVFWIGRRIRQITTGDELNAISRQGNLLVATET